MNIFSIFQFVYLCTIKFNYFAPTTKITRTHLAPVHHRLYGNMEHFMKLITDGADIICCNLPTLIEISINELSYDYIMSLLVA